MKLLDKMIAPLQVYLCYSMSIAGLWSGPHVSLVSYPILCAAQVVGFRLRPAGLHLEGR